MNPVHGLALGRILIGISALLSPGLTMKLFRLQPTGNPQLPYMSRMFGSREVALGALTLATRGTAQRTLVLTGVAVDAADAASGYLAGREGTVSKPTSAFLTAPAIGAVATGVIGLVLAGRK
jgi:hypothetical protein